LRLAAGLLLGLLVVVGLLTQSADSRGPMAEAMPTPGPQQNPDVATNGRGYLVVWEDGRQTSQTHVFGTRVTSGGRVLDPGGIPIATGLSNQYAPSVGWDGRNYLVTWIDGNGDPETEDLMAARVSPSGRVLDPSPISISAAPHGQSRAALGWTGRTNLLIWQDARKGDAVGMWGTLVDRRGHVLRPDGFQVVPGEQAGNPALSCSRGCLTTWGYDRLNGARVAANGAVLDRNGFSIIRPSPFGMPFDPAIATGGRDWLVVWRQHWNDREREADISAIRVSRGGRVRERAPIRVISAGGYQMDPDVAWTGANYLVVYADDRTASWDIGAVRLSPSGRVLDRKPIRIHPGHSRQVQPAVASNGRNSLVVWQGWGPSPADIYGARVTHSGRVLERRDRTWGDRFLISVGNR
jgi:hypothetical protein